MRNGRFGFVLVLFATGAAGCSHGTVHEPPPPTPREDRHPPAPSRTLTLAAAVDEPAAAANGDADAGEAPPPSLKDKTILHVGDSMVGGEWGLTRALEKRFTAEGAKFVRHYKVSESILGFEKSTTLKDLFAKHNPDIVIVTLGTNDTMAPFPQSLGPHVAAIARQMTGRECYWMSPPITKRETGITSVIRDNAAPCTFFDSSKLRLEIGHDGIHPTERGAQDWAARFWTFFRVPHAR